MVYKKNEFPESSLLSFMLIAKKTKNLKKLKECAKHKERNCENAI